MKRAPFLVALLLSACGGTTKAQTQSDAGGGGVGGGGGGGALVSDPGAIACGASSCATPDEQCCVQGSSSSCIGKQICDRGQARACDETRDCNAGSVCCYTVFTNGFPDDVASQCAPDCIRNSIAFQACKTDADCMGTGMPCVASTCRDRVVGTCGTIPPAFCH